MAALEGHGIGAYNHLTSFPPAALGGVGWSEQTQQTEDYCPACPAPCVGSSPDPLVGCCGQCCGHGREEAGWDLFARHWERAVRSWHLPEATRTKDVRRPVGSSLTRMMPLSRVTEPSVFAGGGFEAEFIGASHAKSPPSPAQPQPYPSPSPASPLAPGRGTQDPVGLESIPALLLPPGRAGLTSCTANTGCWGSRGCGKVGAGTGA